VSRCPGAVALNDRGTDQSAGIADQAVDEIQLRARHDALAAGDDGGVDRHRDQQHAC
jgi:hypothetical protein